MDMVMNRWQRFHLWLLDKIAIRDELRTYLGHGDYATERGWWFRGKWISYDGWFTGKSDSQARPQLTE